MIRSIVVFAFSLFLTFDCHPQSNTPLTLFASGDAGYACFRIPAIVQLSEGKLVVFAEGRRHGCSDFGDVDIVMRKSSDGGISWSPIEVVVDNGSLQAGNAAPVVCSLPDSSENFLMLLYNTGDASEWDVRSGAGKRKAWMISTHDGGRSWTEPLEISSQIHFDQDNTLYPGDERTLAFTPGHAIQLSEPPYSGRIFVAANHSSGPPQESFGDYRAFGIYSDDMGLSWRRSPDVPVPSSNEATAAELKDGTLMMNIRLQDGVTRRRLVALSVNGGESWRNWYIDSALVSPVCEASVLHVKTEDESYTLFSGPNDELERKNLSLWIGDESGQHWRAPRTVYAEGAAYSDMTETHTGTIALVYESDEYHRIVFERIEWSKWLDLVPE